MIEVGQLTDKLSTIRELPTFPTTALEVMRLASDSETSVAELSKIVSRDPALSARILRVANSKYYGLAKKISTIEWAIVALGFETLRKTVLSLTLIDLFKGAKHFDPRRFWKHAMDTASAARSIAKEMKNRIPGEAYAAGLLHDIGTLVLYRFFSEDFEEIQRLEEKEGLPLSQAELVVVGTSHADIGAWLAEKWNFPAHFVEAIRYHHSPGYAQINPELTAIVHVANQIACFEGYSCSDSPIKFDETAVQILGIDRLGVSFKTLAEKHITDDPSLTVNIKVRVMDYASAGKESGGKEDEKGTLAAGSIDRTLRNFLKDAIKLLPSKERLVLTLKLYEGLDIRQIAIVLGYEEARVAEYYKSAIAVLQQMGERAILTNRLNQRKTRY